MTSYINQQDNHCGIVSNLSKRTADILADTVNLVEYFLPRPPISWPQLFQLCNDLLIFYRSLPRRLGQADGIGENGI